jgi:hypothetical protein
MAGTPALYIVESKMQYIQQSATIHPDISGEFIVQGNAD